MTSPASPRKQANTGARGSKLKTLYARFGPFVRFCITGGSGLVVNEAVLGLFTLVFGVHYLVSPIFATLVSSSWNFALTQIWVFRAERNQSTWYKRVVPFFLLSFAALALRLPIYAFITIVFHVNFLISNIIALGLLMIVRYLVARNFIWRPRQSQASAAPQHVVHLD
jgi:putative flippase GtrA